MDDPLRSIDQKYFEKIQDAVVKAIIKESLSEDGSVSFVRTGEVCLALLMSASMMCATSKMAATPAGRRFLSERVQSKFKKWTDQFRVKFEAGELDWLSVRSEDEKPH